MKIDAPNHEMRTKGVMPTGSMAAGGVTGFIFGELIGFLLRPTVPIMIQANGSILNAQLPLWDVLSRGSTLKGLDTSLVHVAQISFNYMLVGATLATIGGIIAGSFIDRPAQGTTEICFGCSLETVTNMPECRYCGAATSRQRQRIALGSILATIALPLATMHLVVLVWLAQ